MSRCRSRWRRSRLLIASIQRIHFCVLSKPGSFRIPRDIKRRRGCGQLPRSLLPVVVSPGRTFSGGSGAAHTGEHTAPRAAVHDRAHSIFRRRARASPAERIQRAAAVRRGSRALDWTRRTHGRCACSGTQNTSHLIRRVATDAHMGRVHGGGRRQGSRSHGREGHHSHSASLCRLESCEVVSPSAASPTRICWSCVCVAGT